MTAAALLALCPDDTVLCAASLSGRRWALRAHDARLASVIAREHQLPDVLAGMLAARGMRAEEAADFLKPSLKNALPDPCHLLDMEAAAERVAAAVIGKETVGIFGDYDVDGATSTALLLRYFRALGTPARFHIPDRMKEGYGPNAPALLNLKAQGASLILTVDCGTLAFEPLEAAHAARLDVIVVDHHQGEARRPKALAVVNPNRIDETSPCRHLAAVGVAFLLCVAVSRALRRGGYFTSRPEPDLKNLLDLVALGTVCDVVSLTGLNRAFVTQGLKVMGARGNLGIRTLLDASRVTEKPGAYHLGFILGPRVNAGGRVGRSDYGARLLATEDEAEARHLAAELCRYNEERKAIETLMLDDALEKAAAQAHRAVIVVTGDSWHAGVIGIIAGRIKERFGKPAAAIAFDGQTGKASARSVSGFDFGASVIAAVGEGLLMHGGGHAMAAGFTVARGQLPGLHDFFEQRAAHCREALSHANDLALDGCIALPGANHALAKALEAAAPYGAGNPQPRLCVRGAKIVQADIVGESHVRLAAIDAGGMPGRLSAIAFRCADTELGQALLAARGRTLDLAGTLKYDEWNGRQSACLHIEDACYSV